MMTFPSRLNCRRLTRLRLAGLQGCGMNLKHKLSRCHVDNNSSTATLGTPEPVNPASQQAAGS